MSDLMSNKQMSCKKKIRHALKLGNFYKIKNGIFHKKTLSYSSKCAIFSTILTIVSILIFLVRSMLTINEFENINIYRLKLETLKDYNIIKPDFDSLRKYIIQNGDDNFDINTVGYLPLLLSYQQLKCDDLSHTI